MEVFRTELKLYVVVLLLCSQCQANIDFRCWLECYSSLKKDFSRCIIRCGRINSEQSSRNKRSVQNATVTTAPTRKSRKIYRQCFDIPHGTFNPRFAIKNAIAANQTILFEVYQNKTIARINWDIPSECKNRPNVCKGYLVTWEFTKEYYCHIIYNKSKTFFVLDESTGFDGRKPLGFLVRAIPCEKPMYGFEHIYPPSIDNLPQLVPRPTELATSTLQNERSSRFTTFHTEPPYSTNASSTSLGMRKNVGRNSSTVDPPATTIIIPLVVFVLVTAALVGAVFKWLYKRPLKRGDSPNYHKDFNSVIKGTIYISYLPEKTTMHEVESIYSWLNSHGIDVVMDCMYNDPKLYNSLGPKRFGEKFIAAADKVIMIVTPGYLKLCWLDVVMDTNSTKIFNSLDEERLFSEVTYIKDELSRTLPHRRHRFIPLLLNVTGEYLPRWLSMLTKVEWPGDAKINRFLSLLNEKVQPNDKNLKNVHHS